MKLFSITFSLLVVVCMASCMMPKQYTSSVKPTEIKGIMKFEPLSYISLIETGNRAKYNDSVSLQSKQLLSEALNNFKNIPLTGDIIITDTLLRKKISGEINYLFLSATNTKKIAALKLTPTLDSLLEKNEKRFGLIAVSTGFTRKKGNYGNQVAKGVGMAVLTLGMYSQTPVKANSSLWVMIVDAQENNISFFNKSFLQDKEPLDASVITKQVQNIFKEYKLSNSQ